MPDFNVLSEQLRADLSRVDWSPAGEIRAAGTRRRRNQMLGIGAVSVAVVAVVASGGATGAHGTAYVRAGRRAVGDVHPRRRAEHCAVL
jgi:hypothetical protein